MREINYNLIIDSSNYEGYLGLYKLYKSIKDDISIPIFSIDDINRWLEVFSNYDDSKTNNINILFARDYKEMMKKQYQCLSLFLLRMKILKWRYPYINLQVGFGHLEEELVRVGLLKYSNISHYKIIDFDGFEKFLETKEKIDNIMLFDVCKYKPLSCYNDFNVSYIKKK